jgi:hypothetical protein
MNKNSNSNGNPDTEDMIPNLQNITSLDQGFFNPHVFLAVIENPCNY